MKIMKRMTKKDLECFYGRCIRLPGADPIINACQKIGWNDGVYGWNYSVYTIEGFGGTIIEGYRSFPSWAIVPTSRELEELHNAYQSGNRALLAELFYQVKGRK